MTMERKHEFEKWRIEQAAGCKGYIDSIRKMPQTESEKIYRKLALKIDCIFWDGDNWSGYRNALIKAKKLCEGGKIKTDKDIEIFIKKLRGE